MSRLALLPTVAVLAVVAFTGACAEEQRKAAQRLTALQPASAQHSRLSAHSAFGLHGKRKNLGMSKQLLAAAGAQPKGCSMTMTIVQIVNNVAGAGILTLAAGMAEGVGWIPAIIICLTLGTISGFTFYLIGAACEMTGETSFKGLWSRTLGARSAWIVDGCIALMCLSCAIIYSGILGDVFQALLTLAGVRPSAVLRSATIITLTACVLTPLSLLKDLSALSFTSALGCVAILYTAAFVVTRALDGSYAPPSALLQSLSPSRTPSFTKSSISRLDARALVLVSNLGLAFIAHYNAPAFYEALERRSVRRFGKAVGVAFAILTLLYTAMMGFGYLTFGDNAASNLLLNYAENDRLAVVGRLATGASILFGYPLAMVGLRNSLSGMCASLSTEPALPPALKSALGAAADESARVPLILGLLALITAIACTVEDIGVVVGVSGALLGAAIVYTFPPLIYGKARGASTPKPIYALVPLGLFLGGLGTYMTLKGA